MTRTRARARRQDDRGVALLEFAIVAPLLFALMLGMFTGGFAFNQKLSITNGAREGSRYGATLSVASSSCTAPPTSGTMACWLQNVADVVEKSSEGTLSSGSTRSICVAYVYPSGTLVTDQSAKLVRTSSGDSVTTGSTVSCFDDGRASSERRTQVVASRQGSIQYIFGTANPTLSASAVTRYEGA